MNVYFQDIIGDSDHDEKYKTITDGSIHEGDDRKEMGKASIILSKKNNNSSRNQDSSYPTDTANDTPEVDEKMEKMIENLASPNCICNDALDTKEKCLETSFDQKIEKNSILKGLRRMKIL